MPDDAVRDIEPRAYRPEDAEAIRELVHRTIDACYTGVYPPAAVAFFKDYHSRRNIEADAGRGYTIVLETGGRIVGVGCLLEATIKRVFVLPEYQHRGLGRLIMARLEDEARRRGLTTVSLDSSLVSKRLYDLLGYRGDELVHQPLGFGFYLDHYEMTKKLL